MESLFQPITFLGINGNIWTFESEFSHQWLLTFPQTQNWLRTTAKNWSIISGSIVFPFFMGETFPSSWPIMRSQVHWFIPYICDETHSIALYTIIEPSQVLEVQLYKFPPLLKFFSSGMLKAVSSQMFELSRNLEMEGITSSKDLWESSPWPRGNDDFVCSCHVQVCP